MKKIIALLITSLGCVFCSPQMKINKNKDVDILTNASNKLGQNTRINYIIKNKSNNTYIIDPYGFSGDSYWLFKNNKLNSIDISRGYYSRNGNDCENDLIILEPHQEVNSFLVLNYRDKYIYDLSKSGKYIWNVKSKHDKQNSMPISCRQYISELENNGYHFLEDSIVAKIPFIRE